MPQVMSVRQVLFYKKELNTHACYVVDELPKHYAKWKKPHIKLVFKLCEISRIGKSIDRKHIVSAQMTCGASGLESGWSQGMGY